MIRSFLAVELPGTIRKKIEEVQRDLKSSRADARWVNPENIHLTLKFFGNIEESKVEAIATSIDGLIRTTPPFPLKVRGMGAFPDLRHPRVVWMGLIDEKGTLVPLQKAMEASLEKVGFQPEDRSFKPHLTLGRVKSGQGKDALAAMVEKYREDTFGEFQVERVVLFKSDLRPSGSVHTSLKAMVLGASGKEQSA